MKNEIINMPANNPTSDAMSVVKNLCKTFGTNNEVLKGVNLTVEKGQNLVLMGRSGSGKSIIIKCIIGLIHPDKGTIMVMGSDITQLSAKKLNEIRLHIGFLFQSAALYDSMSVRENLGFPLKRHSPQLTDAEVEEAIMEVLSNVGLEEAIEKMPDELSGGMRKRISLARTLILKPEMILYDEPTTGLDTITAREISELILTIQKKNKTSSIIITHDLACAKLTGDTILILKDGIINAEGSYQELAESKDGWIRSFFH